MWVEKEEDDIDDLLGNMDEELLSSRLCINTLQNYNAEEQR